MPRVAVPMPFNQQWLDAKLHGKVTSALHKIDDDALGARRVGRMGYVVEATACAPSEAAARAS